jgi:hypothetical protein
MKRPEIPLNSNPDFAKIELLWDAMTTVRRARFTAICINHLAAAESSTAALALGEMMQNLTPTTIQAIQQIGR